MRFLTTIYTFLLLSIATSLSAQLNFTWDVDTGCVPLEVRFAIDTGSVDMSTVTSADWDFDNGNVESANGTDTVSTVFLSEGTYRVGVSLNTGASATKFYTGAIRPVNTDFRVEELPSPEFTYGFTPLVDTSNQAIVYNVAWEHFDGSTALKPRVVHIIDHTQLVDINDQITYPDTGTYRAVLMVRENHPTFTCIATRDSAINVQATFDIPNAYSTKTGEYYRIDPKDPAVVLSFKLFSRTGIKVFEQEAPQIFWDGRNSAGQEVSPGVYFYIIEATQGDPSDFYTKQGFIHLFK
jgi:hypothetical protein